VEKLLNNKDQKSIILPTDNGYARVNVSQIYYIETDNKSLCFHTIAGTFYTRDSMKNTEATLSEYNFFRCNSCYLINLAYVSQIKRNIVVIAGHELTISRPRHKDFLEALTKYVGGK